MTDQPPGDQHDSQQPSSTELITNVSGGISLDAQRDVNIGGDVVGRDKITEIVTGDKVAGDKIVEQQITATGRGIAIGKLNIPIVPLAAALGLGLVALVLIVFISSRTQQQVQQFLPTPTPVKMQRTFNVAIAEFAEEDAAGRVQVTDSSRRLSQRVYDTLLGERDAFPESQLKTAIEIRYGPMPITDNLVLDEPAAALVADRLGADMVIYGLLDRAGNLTPQFYVSSQVRADIDALLTGNHRVGDQPIQFAQDSRVNADTDLGVRASALFYLAAGLTYDVFGRIDKSLKLYRQAEEVLADWPEIGAGKELLYFFIGQAALFRAQQERQTDRAAAQELVDEAETAFRQALRSKPDYARAYVGLGSVFYTRLQLAPAIGEMRDSTDMQQMFEGYAAGQQLARDAGERLVELVATWSVGLGYYQKGRATQAQDGPQAADLYRQAITLIQSTLDPLKQLNQPRVLAQAYLGLGAVQRELAALLKSQGDEAGSRAASDEAKQALQECIALGSASQDRVLKELIAGQRCQPVYDKLMQNP
jgi:tetratricopeptide (TPR) repeat protein